MKYITIYIVLIFLFSCEAIDKTNNDNHIVLRINDESGNLTSEVSVELDSFLKDGLTKNYERNGNPTSIINYKKGRKNGKAFYYNNGILIGECFFSKDQEINYSILYENKKLSQYAFIDKNGNVRYILDYDSLGKIIKKEGHFFYIMYDKKTKLDNGKYKMIVHTARPPKSKVNFSIIFNDSLVSNYEIKDKTEFVILRDSYDKLNPVIVKGFMTDSITNNLIDSYSIKF